MQLLTCEFNQDMSKVGRIMASWQMQQNKFVSQLKFEIISTQDIEYNVLRGN
jgi:hypothetical protein